MVNRILRILITAAQRMMTWLTLRRPALAPRLAGPLGAVAALRPNAWRAPAADTVQAIFGPLPPARVRRIWPAIASLQFVNEALAALIRRRGVDPLLPLVTTIHAEPLLRLRQTGVPIVVVSWHQGPMRAASLALRKLGVPTLFAVFDVLGEPDGENDLVRYADLQGGVNTPRFLKRAHDALAGGVVVGLHLDWPAPASLMVPFLGRRVRFARGAASLARISGARLIPVTRRCLGATGRIEVTFHEPIDDADLDRASGNVFEATLLARAAERFEIEARKDPGSVRPDRFEWLLAAPPVGGWATEADPDLSGLTPRAARRVARQRNRRLAQRRKEWEADWERGTFDPPWLGRAVSPEIEEAVASGWFIPGSRALDAGCGEGDVAAWLATRGYPAVGVDVADAAIRRARDKHGEHPGTLRFAREDLCEHAPDGGPFGVVVDRGLFLHIPDDDRRSYANHLASVCTADARCLLFCRAFRAGIRFGDPDDIDLRRSEVVRAFGTHFEIERLAPTYLDRYQGQRPDQRLPGIVFWLRRRPS